MNSCFIKSHNHQFRKNHSPGIADRCSFNMGPGIGHPAILPTVDLLHLLRESLRLLLNTKPKLRLVFSFFSLSSPSLNDGWVIKEEKGNSSNIDVDNDLDPNWEPARTRNSFLEFVQHSPKWTWPCEINNPMGPPIWFSSNNHLTKMKYGPHNLIFLYSSLLEAHYNSNKDTK